MALFYRLLRKVTTEGRLRPYFLFFSMRNLTLATLVISSAFLASCGPTTVTTSNANMNAMAPTNTNVSMSNTNMTAPATSSGSTASGATTFTAAEVAKHNNETDCYAIVADGVYNLTEWINEHPGGPEAIMGTCGKDITKMTHPGGIPMTEQIKNVPQFKVGTLAQ